MPGRFKKIRIVVFASVVFAAFVYFNNASWLADPIAERPHLVAHRGLAQAYSREGLTGKTCTATRMIPTGHDRLENPLPSMAAAFELGADAVELDVHRTTDDRFAVFHDWTLDCRTDGSGVTHEHTLSELQRLDVGYGYTADGGKTFPFRDTGVGMMPSLEQVLDTFPDRALVIDMKTNDAEDGVLLGDYGGEGFSSGFDNPQRARELPEDYSGGIWTDRIDLLGPALRSR
jgi:glycerophosphoryl diester phosphodiesterase